ncbi:MAG: hypothetical protein HYW27_02765 [Candidatus Aenigmarchaeota archaeon]|nr:hypothetical protein [Candidatus Aenigmarchaeota archaeon]
MEQFKRAAARRCKISDIKPEKDIRVRIFGKVIDRMDDMLVIDDGTGKIEMITENPAAETGSSVFAIARILPLESGYEARAELVNGAPGLDAELYRKVFG